MPLCVLCNLPIEDDELDTKIHIFFLKTPERNGDAHFNCYDLFVRNQPASETVIDNDQSLS